MADRSRPLRRRERAEPAEAGRDVQEDRNEGPGDGGEVEVSKPGDVGGLAVYNGAAADAENGELEEEQMEVPPFEIIAGDRIDPFLYKFQFKNVEYSSGRNKTLLCYLVDRGGSEGLLRGYLEDEHSGPHAEEAFFVQCLPHCDPAAKYTVTWYVSSSPCCSCAAKLADLLKARRNVRLNIFAARLFEWEEPEIRAGLKALSTAGCKLRVMKPLDFSYTWDTFVDNIDEPLNLWEDCKENYEFYQDKLADILQ